MKTQIMAIGHYLPEHIVDNHLLSKDLDTSDEWIYTHTGIQSRHVAAWGQTNCDLAEKACVRLQENYQKRYGKPFDWDELDFIIVSTTTPDHFSTPTVASVLQSRLTRKHVPALDINAACTGGIYALDIADQMILAGNYKKILVIASEVCTRFADWTDRKTCILFGDGAGAILLENNQSHQDGLAYLGSGELHSDGQQNHVLQRKSGGVKHPLAQQYFPDFLFDQKSLQQKQQSDDNDKKENVYLYMDGQKVFLFAIKAINQIIQGFIQQGKVQLDELDYIVAHQANKRILQSCANNFQLPLEKFYINIDQTGNTSSASIFIALSQMWEQGLFKNFKKMILVGFGGGLTYAGKIIEAISE